MDLPFILLHITIVLLIFMFIYIFKIKSKKQVHYVFVGMISALLIWSISTICKIYFYKIYGINILFFYYLLYIGLVMLPVLIFLLGEIFAYTKINFDFKYKVFFIVPILSIVLIFTNSYHHLFYKEINYASSKAGPYFYIHTIYGSVLMLLGLYKLVYFSIKNSGFFSKQSFLIIIGTLFPFSVNVIITFWTVDLPFYSDAISFSFAAICFAFAIFKFDFLNIVPIALEKVVDHISDSYIVLNEDYEIIDYNKTFVRTFGTLIKARRKSNFIEHIYSIQSVNIVPEQIEQFIETAIETKKSNIYEKHFVSADGSFDKHFEIEFTPIMSKKIFIGILILFRDVTQHVENVEKIKQTQNQLMQKERLASLGELAGGVAHDINSPLSAMQNDIYIINALAKKAIDSGKIEDESILKSLNEMTNRAKNLTNATQKIVKIVNSVRNHTRNLSGETIQDFYIGSVLDDLKILLDHHLKKAKCELDINSQNVQITGDPGKLSQVMTNLIMNAVQAYSGDAGKIEVELSSKDEKALIKVRDYAGGIPEEFQNGIFKNILTTKGTEGTGLGLYLCYSIITGNFGGKIWFESKEGEGTTFFVEIPMKKAAIVHSN